MAVQQEVNLDKYNDLYKSQIKPNPRRLAAPMDCPKCFRSFRNDCNGVGAPHHGGR
jgi:hypothetical protein